MADHHTQTAANSMSQTMRIVHVIPTLDRGGAEKQVAQLSVELARQGYAITVVAGRGGSWESYLAQHGIRVITLSQLANRGLNSRRSIGYNLVAIQALYRIFRDIKPHVVNSFLYPAMLWTTFAAALARVPVIINNQRDCGFMRDAWPLPAWVERSAWRLTSRFVVNSRAAAGYLEDTLAIPADRVTLIYAMPAAPENASSQWIEPLDAPSGTILIGMLANFTEHKNHLLLVRAAKIITQHVDQVLFVLAGYPTNFQQVVEQEIARLELTEQFRLVGPIQDIDGFVQSMDIGVLTSMTESFSNALLEFMAHAKPVVATHVGGNVEMVNHGETGMLVALDDSDQLASALLALIQSPEQRSRMGALARKSVQIRYDWKIITPQWITFFENVLPEYIGETIL
jgi:glycosyltransferase involved in cell wall biosynthesis